MWPIGFRKAIVGLALGLAVSGMTDRAAAQERGKGDDRFRDRQAERERVWNSRDDDDIDYNRTDRFRVYRDGRYYKTDGRGADLLRDAITAGYRQGHASGRADSEGRKKSNCSASVVYRDGSYGYETHVDPAQYKYYFRQGFQLGYGDGFSGRFEHGYPDDGKLHLMVSVLNRLLTVTAY